MCRSTSRGTKSPNTPSPRLKRRRAWRRSSTNIPIASCSGPTRWRQRGRRRTTPSSTCGPPSSRCSPLTRASKCGRVTTSGSSTRDVARSAPGRRTMRVKSVLFLALLAFATPAGAQAPAQPDPKPSMEIYGFAMLDIGHDFKQINPNWSDTMRVTKLPKVENEFGRDHNTFAGVRQSRLGVRATTPTDLGDLKTTFEFELFGTGVDEGQTTFRLRHAYGEVGKFGAGQYWSPFMDIDVFPNSLEYWGPTGMVFFRNVQFRYYPWSDDKSSVVVAVER